MEHPDAKPALPSAPASFVYCPRCATPLETREVVDRPRRVCPACGFIHFTDPKVGVGVLVLQDNKILLVQRTMNPERGKWAIPAGFLDHGEDPRVAAAREVAEETGLEVTIDGVVDVYHNPPEQGGASIFILFQGRVSGGQLRAGADASAAAFFDAASLPDLAFSSTRAAVRALQ